MSTSNRTFSIDKNRELSPLEARVGSIRKRLVNTFGNKNNLKSKSLPTALQDHLPGMGPKNKNRRAEANGGWEGSEADESHHGSGQQDGTGDLSNNGHASKNANGRRSHPSQGSSAQHEHQHGLGPWTQAVNETIRTVDATQRAIGDLQHQFTLHKNQLSTMDDTRNRLNQLKQVCIDKDAKIHKQENAIEILKDMAHEAHADIERQKAEIEQERQLLDQDIAKQKKRALLAAAEEKRSLDEKSETLSAEQEKSTKKRMKELEDEFSKKSDENNRRVTSLESERDQLRRTVEDSKRDMEIQREKLAKFTGLCEVQEIAIDTFKAQKKAAERELEMMKKEFALDSKSIDHFQQGFADIRDTIQEISWKYFNDLEGKDPEDVHEKLAKANSVFESVPIDDSDDSHKLRAAHAQHIISSALCEYIWKPFRSELTLSHPMLSDLLGIISGEIENYSHGGRAAHVWKALTMRALQALPKSTLTKSLESKKSDRPAPLGRTESVISGILSVLSPLVHRSQDVSLRKDLSELSDSAIELWNDTQTGQLEITVNSLLQNAHREEWRSQEFDPESAENKLGVVSKTHPRIFTLFPEIIALEVADSVVNNTDLPGSWPKESEPIPRMAATRIYPGKGLLESSPLVVRGKEARREKAEYLQEGLQNLKKQFYMSNRRDSIGSNMSGPTSPSERWKKEGAMKFQEK